MDKDIYNKQRYLLKTDIRKKIDINDNDMNKGIPMPDIQKNPTDGEIIIDLPSIDSFLNISDKSTVYSILNRKTKRKYEHGNVMSLIELSWLLFSTQGVRAHSGQNYFRTVPSAGNRHAFDTYIAIFNVDGLEKGIYRYLPKSHQIVFQKTEENLEYKISKACKDQSFVSNGSVTFIWVAVPYRMEWKYTLAAHKSILLDAGHICQNLYLAAEAIDYGCCAIGNYDQDLIDELLELDTEDEFTVYLSPVGK
ncbi:MAG: SagB/ThcOx family dehydrogenase [Gudongella sp.]|nr:SagB/ThcOx family dehydrogenase [Gudongella sp.]